MGQRRLWAAVLALARRDAHARGRAGRRRRDAAIAWIVDASMAPGSFRWVCQALGIEPVRTKRRLLLEIGRPYTARWLVRVGRRRRAA